MNWDAFHRRGDVLHAVIDEVDQRRDGVLPMDLPGVAETFADENDLLSALSLRWHARLAAFADQELQAQPADLSEGVSTAWRRAAEDVPGIRQVLDHHIAHPVDAAMAETTSRMVRKERELLALWSGLVSAYQVDEFGARMGAQVEAKARAGFSIPGPGSYVAPSRTLLSRLKAAVA